MKIKLLLGAAALGLAAPALVAQVPAPTHDLAPMAGQSAADYVNHAADGDMYEKMSSETALQRSKTKTTRSFAQMMIRDHTKSTDMLKKAAMKSSLTPPMSPTPETQAKLDALKSASDADFDTMYWDGQKQAHDMAWMVHAGYAKDGSDAALKGVATNVRGVVETHMKHLQDMRVKPVSGS